MILKNHYDELKIQMTVDKNEHLVLTNTKPAICSVRPDVSPPYLAASIHTFIPNSGFTCVQLVNSRWSVRPTPYMPSGRHRLRNVTAREEQCLFNLTVTTEVQPSERSD